MNVNMTGKPDISVAVITYNQEEYIAQALESVLMQKTDFSFEIVIGEDCSGDGTPEILARYAEKFPEKINLIERKENLGSVKNLADVIRRCKGRYIAFLEGDDYWLSEAKLQTQTKFLEENVAYTSCFAAVDIIGEGGESLNGKWLARRADVSDYLSLASDWSIPTCTVVMRNVFTEDYLSRMLRSAFICDRLLHMFAIRHGMIKYLNYNFGVYRYKTSNSYASRPILEKCSFIASVMRAVYDLVEDKYKYCVLVELKALGSKSKFIANEVPDLHECVVCGNKMSSFIFPLDFHTYRIIKKYNVIGSDLENFSCPHCGSIDRERHLLLYFKRLNLFGRMNADTKILHVAPEPNFKRMLLESAGTYIGMDSEAERFNSPFVVKLNLLELPFIDNYFDVIICNHVLEHIADDEKAMSEIYRTLKTGGYAILQTPYSPDLSASLQYDWIKTDDERLEHYGQADHVRIYGTDFFEKLKKAGFSLRTVRNDVVCNKDETFYYGVNGREDLIMCMKYA